MADLGEHLIDGGGRLAEVGFGGGTGRHGLGRLRVRLLAQLLFDDGPLPFNLRAAGLHAGEGEAADDQRHGCHRAEDGEGRRRRPPLGPFPGALPGRRRPGLDRLAVEEAAQVVGQVAGRRRSAWPAPFRRHFRQIVSRSRGTFGWSVRGGTGSPVQHLLQRVHHRRRRGTAAGRSAARRGSPPGRRRRPAGPTSWILPARLLRGHVARRAQDGPVCASAPIAFQPLGQAEVGDLGHRVRFASAPRRLATRRPPSSPARGCWPASGRGG